jgi:hypothetical protein
MTHDLNVGLHLFSAPLKTDKHRAALGEAASVLLKWMAAATKGRGPDVMCLLWRSLTCRLNFTCMKPINMSCSLMPGWMKMMALCGAPAVEIAEIAFKGAPLPGSWLRDTLAFKASWGQDWSWR